MIGEPHLRPLDPARGLDLRDRTIAESLATFSSPRIDPTSSRGAP